MSAFACCVLVRRFHGGVDAATLGIDFASVGRAPIGEGLRVDVDADGRLAFSPELSFCVADSFDKFGIAVVKGVAVFHDAPGGNPLLLGEKGDGDALCAHGGARAI
jgi:hypothetical protein